VADHLRHTTLVAQRDFFGKEPTICTNENNISSLKLSYMQRCGTWPHLPKLYATIYSANLALAKCLSAEKGDLP
jgi:hypothetical protein